MKFKENFTSSTMTTGNITPYSSFKKPVMVQKHKKFIKKILNKKLGKKINPAT